MYKNEDIDNLEQWQDLNEDYDEINKDKDNSSDPEILEPEILEPERDSSY